MNFIYSILFGASAYFLYKFHKIWLVKREGKFQNVTKIQGLHTWLLIFMLIIASVFCLFV